MVELVVGSQHGPAGIKIIDGGANLFKNTIGIIRPCGGNGLQMGVTDVVNTPTADIGITPESRHSRSDRNALSSNI
ncbi:MULTISPECIES: hypothetical protein [unclassified Bosea (in: a-proteobacteria)]|uniref:hypothetical protein n=1 Tax=unclassified Bosea (in: a-proteobacteria) TaxID=2653178 RepID=UPI000F7EC9BA|nr:MULTISPECIES: hypothetical protein [unclassified Bosea (in: a-proteobacteria)]